MKLIYKTRNLALTALFGAALAMGTPAAMAQTIDENVEPAPDQQEPASYEGDVALIKQLTDFVLAQMEECKQNDPEAYAKLESQYYQIINILENADGLVIEANREAELTGEAYESPLGDDFAAEIQEMIANMDKNIVDAQIAAASDQVEELAASLQGKIDELKEVFEEKVGDQIEPDDEDFFLNTEEADKINAELDAMIGQIKAAADKAEELNFEKFESPVTQEWIADMTQQISDFYDEGEFRINNAQANLQLHDEDVETINTVEESLAAASEAINENIKAKLGDEELTEEQEAFFTGEATFNEIQTQIDALRVEMGDAYDAAAADHWQKYESKVSEGITPLDKQIQDYQDETESLANKAQAMHQQHDEDIDLIMSLEDELAQAQDKIAEKYNAALGDMELDEEDEAIVTNAAAFEAIQAQIEKLRQAVVAEAEKAEADNWQSYSQEATGVEEAAQGLYEEVLAYEEAGLNRVDKALDTIKQHDADIAALMGMEGQLYSAIMDAQSLYAEKLEPELGELTEEQEDFFYNQAGADEVQAIVDNARKAMVDAYDAALKDGLESYESPVTEELTAEFDAKLQEYKDDCEYRINKAMANLQLHDEDVEMINAVEENLAAASEAINENIKAKLGDEELTEEQEAFFTGEATFNEIQNGIDALRQQMIAAYDAAAADNWQSYESKVNEGITPLDEQIQQYQDATEYLANKAQAMQQQHDEDIDLIMSLEEELAQAAQAVADKYNSLIGEDIELSDKEIAAITNESTFDAIQAEIEKLRAAVVAEAEKAEADNWQSYSQEATGVEENAQGIYEEILAYQEDATKHVEAVVDVIKAHDENINILMGLENKLMEGVQKAQALYAEKLEPEIGEADDAFFFDEEGFDAVQAEIDNERNAVAQAYDAAVASDYTSYESPITDEWVAQVEAQIQDYADEIEYRVLNAVAQLQLFEEDLELVQGLDSELFSAVVAAQNKIMELLGVDELTDEQEEFFLDEKDYNAIQAKIDALRQSVVAAYDVAAADNWQNYNQEASGVKDNAQAIYEEILKYQDDTEYLANNAQAQMQLHDEDVELLETLDNELFNVVVAVQQKMQDQLAPEVEITDEMAEYFQYEPEFDAIQAQIDALRQSVVAAYDAAEADNWQNYDQEASGVKEHAQAIYEEILAYQDECEYRVNNAVANVQLHGEDADMIYDLEAALQNVYDKLATEAEGAIDADILDGIRYYLFVAGYEDIVAQIEALRADMVAAYDAAAADNWQSYEQQVVPNASPVDEAIAEYDEVSSIRTLLAVENVEAHQYDLDLLLPLDEMLGDSVEELMEEKPELFEEGSEFVQKYEEYSAQVEALWNAIAQAATDAEENYWQTYEPVMDEEVAEALYSDIETFFAEAWGDAGNVNMNNWNKDNNSILALESMLMGAVETIQETNPEYDVDPEFDAIQAAIDNLRQEMAKAYEAAEATEWETYECPYTEADLQAVEDMIDEMVAHATGTSAIESVAGEEEQPMIFSIDGKRLNAPVKGELNIFVYKNRVEKKIVK